MHVTVFPVDQSQHKFFEYTRVDEVRPIDGGQTTRVLKAPADGRQELLYNPSATLLIVVAEDAPPST